jgi:two-component system, sporulation sensor kinase E
MAPDPGFVDRVLERIRRMPPDQIEDFIAHLLKEMHFVEDTLASLPTGVLVADKDFGIRSVNDAAREILSLRAGAKLEAVSLREVLRRAELVAVLDEFQEFHEEIRQREVSLPAPRQKFLNVSVVPFLNHDVEHEGGTVWILEDRTEIERRNEERRQGSRIESLATLTAGIAHEIKNPLNSLTIHIQLLRKGAAKLHEASGPSVELDRMTRSAEILEEEVRRLTTIVEEFLTAVRPIKPTLRKASVNDLMMSLAELLGPECREFGIELVLDLDPSVPLLRLDPELIRQAILNLARNAIEAIHPPGEPEKRNGGRIVLRTQLKSDHALIEVEDDGCGIPEIERLRIFEPYHTTKFNGTGLGLMVVYKCIHAHDGRIGLTSREGVGTVFHIALPLDERPVRLLAAPTVVPLEAEAIPPTDAEG